MDDSEARYLIDQFNKFASWRLRREELRLTVLGPGIAIFAVGISVMFYDKHPWSSTDTILMICSSIALVTVILLLLRRLGRMFDGYADDIARLKALEEHRSKFKSLPNEISFCKIVDTKPKDLEELLKASMPSTTSVR
jgi:hypothetical protein